MSIALHIEALLFASDRPVTVSEIKNCLEAMWQKDISSTEVQNALKQLVAKYEDDHHAMQIKIIADGYTFMTKADYHGTVAEFLKITSSKKLTTAALETLAVIAYKQPVTKTEIESIRGVNCDYTVQKLLEKDLVEISGRKEGPGNPLLYRTSERFMNHFGLKSIDDLPKIRDFDQLENSIGSQENVE